MKRHKCTIASRNDGVQVYFSVLGVPREAISALIRCLLDVQFQALENVL